MFVRPIHISNMNPNEINHRNERKPSFDVMNLHGIANMPIPKMEILENLRLTRSQILNESESAEDRSYIRIKNQLKAKQVQPKDKILKKELNRFFDQRPSERTMILYFYEKLTFLRIKILSVFIFWSGLGFGIYFIFHYLSHNLFSGKQNLVMILSGSIFAVLLICRILIAWLLNLKAQSMQLFFFCLILVSCLSLDFFIRLLKSKRF